MRYGAGCFRTLVALAAALAVGWGSAAAAPAARKKAKTPASAAGKKAKGAKTAPRRNGLTAKQVAAALGAKMGAAAWRRARVSVAAMDLTTGTMLFEHGADQLCSVASNNKLVTTAAALDLLGPDFQFRTTVGALGKVSAKGVLTGDLLVVGRGDPSISGRFHKDKVTAVLEQWADAVVAAGITEVRGGVVVDDSYFDQQHFHPEWPRGQHSAWYCAQVGALSFNDNCVLLVVAPGAKKGAAALCALEPPTRYMRIVNSCHTSRARLGRNHVLAHRALGKNQITVSGSIRDKGRPFRTWVTVDDPALFTATVFREVLGAKGVRVGGPAMRWQPQRRFNLAAWRELVTTTSSLGDAVAVANSRSQNFYAEQILKTLGQEKTGKGSWAAGAKGVAGFLRTAGVKGQFDYRDGSGMARANRFSARQLVTLLAYMNGRRVGRVFLHSLAQPGGNGTLRRRLAPLRGRLFAKTGYISGVSALSGYIDTRGGRVVAFSILVNKFRSLLGHVRAAQDAVCTTLAEYNP